MKPDQQRKIGITQILASGFCFGFLGLFGKLAFERGLTPGELLSLRFLLGGILLFAFFLIRNPKKLFISPKEIIYCLVLGTFGYALFSSFYFYALQGLSASLTVLLLYLYPVMVALGGWILFKEKIPKERIFAVPLAVIGMALLVGGDLEVSKFSALLCGVGSAVFYAVYILASSKWLKHTDAIVAVAYIQSFAGLILAILFWKDFARVQNIISVAWPIIILMSIVCSLGAMAFFQAGLKKLKSWEASVLSTAEPITAVLVAMTVLHERLSVFQISGAFLILIALVSVSIPVRQKN